MKEQVKTIVKYFNDMDRFDKGEIKDEEFNKSHSAAMNAIVELNNKCENKKPSWFPECPYPESLFTMTEKEFIEVLPNPLARSRVSGYLGRLFWNMCSNEIYERWVQQQEEKNEDDFCNNFDFAVKERDRKIFITDFFRWLRNRHADERIENLSPEIIALYLREQMEK